jgi:hypothetical protein
MLAPHWMWVPKIHTKYSHGLKYTTWIFCPLGFSTWEEMCPPRQKFCGVTRYRASDSKALSYSEKKSSLRLGSLYYLKKNYWTSKILAKINNPPILQQLSILSQSCLSYKIHIEKLHKMVLYLKDKDKAMVEILAIYMLAVIFCHSE